VLPPALALWMPQALPHEVQGIGGARLRRVVVPLVRCSGFSAAAGVACGRVTLAGPLLKALALTLDGAAEGSATTAHQRLALALAREELEGAEPLPIGVALPSSPTLRATCEAALRAGAGDWDLHDLAAATGTSARQLARLFQRELATSFSHWRMQVRLARLVSLWADGLSLSESAAAVGYASHSAMSYRIRQLLGMPPSQLLSAAMRKPGPRFTGSGRVAASGTAPQTAGA
jgi:AraC-like DNA-binding protein